MNSRLIRTPGLYLVGFMGSGKSTVGPLLADELGWHYCDLDQDIEAEAQTSIFEVFEKHGEAQFRQLEHQALAAIVHKIQRGQPTIVSLGGGAFTYDRNVSLIQDNGVSVWLDCPLERVQQRIAGQNHRPLARDPERFTALFHARQVSYSQAEYRIEVISDDPREAVNAILDLPVF